MNREREWQYYGEFRYRNGSPKQVKLDNVCHPRSSWGYLSHERPHLMRQYNPDFSKVLTTHLVRPRTKDFDKIPRMMSVECANCDNAKCHFSIIESAQEPQARKFLKANMQNYKHCHKNTAYPLTKRRIARLEAKV